MRTHPQFTACEDTPLSVKKQAWHVLIRMLYVLGFVLFLSLAYWQWQRGQTRESVQEHIQQAFENNLPETNAIPNTISLETLLADMSRSAPSKNEGAATTPPPSSNTAPPLLWHVLKVKGFYLNSASMFLDNRVHQGKRGALLITPFIALDSRHYPVIALPVLRGWLSYDAQNTYTQKLAQISLAQAEESKNPTLLTLTTQIVPPPGQMMSLSKENAPPMYTNYDAPSLQRLLQNQAGKELALTSLPLAPVLVQTHDSSPLLQPYLPPYQQMAEKNYAYALQWLSFALLVLVLAVIYEYRRRKSAQQPAH